LDLANPLNEISINLIKEAIQETKWQIETEYDNPEGENGVTLALLQQRIDMMEEVIRDTIKDMPSDSVVVAKVVTKPE
jgi:hypothetical protein